MGSLLVSILRWLCTWLDQCVVFVMDILYDLLIDLSSLNIVSSDIIKGFNNRIGLLLGIFMLFSLAIYFLNYMVSPEKLSDKAKGGGKIILNVFVSLALLGTINWIFNFGYKVQQKIITSNMIPTLIFGVNGSSDVNLSYYVFSGFITVNSAIDSDGVCSGVYLKEDNEECLTLLEPHLTSSGLATFENAIDYKDASHLLDADNLASNTTSGFVFNYLFIFSTVVGVIIVCMLFNFCLDIGKRSVKLYFYQIIAPLPILANMMPGKGEETFKKWGKSCLTTYFDIFIRLIALFFATYMISVVYDSLNEYIVRIFGIGVFIILGALMFAKELPSLIQDLTGIKLDGDFTINPLKKVGQVPLVGNAFGAIGGAIAGGRAGGRVGNFLGGALTGAMMGATSTPLAGRKDGKIFGATNDIYKRMTGNDFVNFSLSKSLLRVGAEGRIKEVKDARNVATAQLNKYNTDLNTSESLTSSLASDLRSKGVNLNNLDNEKNTMMSTRASLRSELLRNQVNYNEAMDNIKKIDKLKNDLNNKLKSKSDELKAVVNNIQDLKNKISSTSDKFTLNNLSRQLAQATADSKALDGVIKSMSASVKSLESSQASYENYKNDYERKQSQVAELDKNISNIEQYQDSILEQNDLRKRIATVQKDIDDLNSEKRQRERFYDWDPSPQDDVKELMSDTKNDYEGRIDRKV